jgi:hypothetical protein
VMHPFDVGDRCEVDGMQVTDAPWCSICTEQFCFARADLVTNC